MPITHEWNGTILTITSDSGTSSADLKGQKGDDGARGAQGIAGSAIAEDTAKLGGIVATEYATKAYVDTAISNADIDLTPYATKDYVDTAVDNVDLSNYYNKTEVDNTISDINRNMEYYATNNYVDNEIEAVKTDMEINYLLKNDTAVNSLKLGGIVATEYAKKDSIGLIKIHSANDLKSNPYEEITSGTWNTVVSVEVDIEKSGVYLLETGCGLISSKGGLATASLLINGSEISRIHRSSIPLSSTDAITSSVFTVPVELYTGINTIGIRCYPTVASRYCWSVINLYKIGGKSNENI